MAMTVTKKDWKVRIDPGDKIRLNAVYDTERASWYEGMGIAVAYVAPDDPHWPPGVDVFGMRNDGNAMCPQYALDDEQRAEELLARFDVAFVHVRSAKYNCYQCRIECG
jgi:hypothetical protein